MAPTFHAPQYLQRPPEQFPPLAPPVVGSPALEAGAAKAPMADGFIDLVNRKYDGNISMALADRQVRSFARAIGLIGGDDVLKSDFSAERVQIIKGILADPHEDGATKISAVRMLLKH